MITVTKCRALGGPAYCDDPDCPEKRAGITVFYGTDTPWQNANAPLVNSTPARPIQTLTGINTPGDPRMADLDARADTFRKTLTQDEEQALGRYIDQSYPINTYLRGGAQGLAAIFPTHYATNPNTINDIENNIHHIDAAIAKQPVLAFPQILYRTFTPKDNTGSIEDYIQTHYGIGKGLHSKAYLSTSVDTDRLLARSGRNQRIVFEILTHQAGATLHNLKHNHASDTEREILLPRDMKLRVTSLRDVNLKTSYPADSPEYNSRGLLHERRIKLVRLEEG